MAITWTPYERLTASQLNLAFADTISKSQTNAQDLASNLNLPSLHAAISVQTLQLIVTGDALFSGSSAIALPTGTTFDRPSHPTFGMLRANSDAGTIECMLASGQWATLVTTQAATTPVTAPVSMSGVQSGQATSTAIPLSWSDPAGGTAPFKFTVNYRLAGTSNWNVWIADVTVHATTVSGLLNATRYEFQVTATNSSGSAASPITATNTQGYLPGGPSNLTTSSPTSTTVGLTWLPVPATVPIAYQVEYAVQGSSSWVLFNGPTMDTFATVTNLPANTTVYFQVTAKTIGASYTSLVSTGVTTAAAIVAPNASTALSFSNVTSDGFTIAWTPPSAGTVPLSYQVQYQSSGSNTWVSYANATPATSVVLTGLNSGAGYNVRVQATNSAGSSFSAISGVNTLAVAPTNNTVAGFQTSGSSYPVLNGPAAAQVTLGSALPITGITVIDPAACYATGTMVLTVACGTGHLTMVDANSNQIISSGTNKISYSGTLSGVQTALASLVYTAEQSGGDNITITLLDQLILQSVLAISTVVVTTSGAPPPSNPPGSTPPPNVTSTGQPTDLAGTPARRAADCLNGFGVNVRLEDPAYNAGYTLAQAAVVENAINYLGGGQIKLLRELCGFDLNVTFLAQVAQNCNAKYILPIDWSANPDYLAVLLSMEQFTTFYQPLIVAFEGPMAKSADLAAAAQFQSTLYTAAHSLGLSAWQLSPLTDTLFNQFGTPPADIGTAICNPAYSPNGGTITAIGGTSGYLATVLGNAGSATPNRQTAITEFGWQSFPVGSLNSSLGFVDEYVQASYLLEFLFSAFKLGATRYIYNELWDVPFGLSVEDTGQRYGLFNITGTPKMAGVALHNLFQLLGDPSAAATSFVSGTLNYSVTSKPGTYGGFLNTGYQDVVFQRSAGDFWIVMWNEQALNTVGGSNATINVANVPITLTFNNGAKSRVTVYDPIQNSTQPVQVSQSVTNVSISLPAHPILVQVVA